MEPAPIEVEGREPYVNDLLSHLLEEHRRNGGSEEQMPDSYPAKRRMLRALLTVRGPEPLPVSFHDQLDRLLAREVLDRGIVDPMSMPEFAPGRALWQGDITTLRAGAIVNAANGALLGCFTPFHMCIDNVIHNAAGPMVRQDCHEIVKAQGFDEPPGHARITRGYNLPADFILHTVGPVWSEDESKRAEHDETLASCYRSCLDLAARIPEIGSIAFCCISTGVFGFPRDRAAHVALKTVDRWLEKNPGSIDKVIFNVFGREDLEAYEACL